MRSIRLFLIHLSALLALVLLAGCGSKSATSGASQPNPGTPKASTRTGTVIVQVDKTFYQAEETITVTIKNQSTHTIAIPDHLTNCTVVLLQHQQMRLQADDPGIRDANPCKLMTATRMHELAAGQKLVVQLSAPKNGWRTGWFLATLSYRSASSASTFTTVSSSAFTIGPSGL